MNKSWWLIILDDSSRPPYRIKQGPQEIGRSDGCQIQLDSPGASRDHAEIVCHQNDLSIRDLNSTNGTFVDGNRINDSLVTLKAGSTIRLGRAVKMRLVDSTDALARYRIRETTVQEDEEPQCGCSIEDGNLTPAETQVLNLFFDGLSKKQVAGQLHRSEETVRSHWKRIYRKLGIHSCAQLINLWLSQAKSRRESSSP